MNNQEIKEWFDNAFDRMKHGDFAVADYFQFIIDHCEDLCAKEIARRHLSCCHPLRAIIERIEASPGSLALDEPIKQTRQFADLSKNDPAYIV